MKRKKRIRSFLAAATCLVVSLALGGITGGAGQTGKVHAAEETPRVIFENMQNETPDLYVSKRIESAGGEVEVDKDLTFSFILKLDGVLADRMEYRVFDESGTEVSNQESGVTVPFRTDRSGLFTLKAGQTAKFEYVGTGVSYEVTEVSREGWQQILPSGGAPAAGIVTDKGAWAEFVNMPETGGGEGQLMVQKTVSFPNGYEMPETPEFQFVLKISGRPWSQEAYTVIDTQSGYETGAGTTGTDGSFTLKGGQRAVFSEVPENVDYEITEAETEGWRVTGEAVRKGSTGTTGAVLEIFNNASASFAVTKSMKDGSEPEDAFTFLLAREDMQVWAGAKYLLYNTDGTAVTENGTPVSGETDADGKFRLFAGQTAVFTGIEAGTVYNVSEEASPDYWQVVPASGSGYTNKVVTDAVEVLPFVNEPAESGLKVSKIVENMDGNAPLEQKEFTFCLTRLSSDGQTYEAVKGQGYSISAGASQSTYQTDENGSFYLKANETALFTGLPDGKYRVEELESGREYEAEETVQEAELSQDNKDVSLTFVNKYTVNFFDLCLEKQDRLEQTPLEGAKFMLYRDQLQQNPVQEEPYVTDQYGKITISDLKTGTYYLVETEAPAGYQLLANPVKIEVTWLEKVMQVTVDGKTVTSDQEDDQIYIRQNTDENDEVHIKIYNSKGFTLPVTGGSIALVLAAACAMAFLFFAGWRAGRKKNGKSKRK